MSICNLETVLHVYIQTNITVNIKAASMIVGVCKLIWKRRSCRKTDMFPTQCISAMFVSSTTCRVISQFKGVLHSKSITISQGYMCNEPPTHVPGGAEKHAVHSVLSTLIDIVQRKVFKSLCRKMLPHYTIVEMAAECVFISKQYL